MRDLVIDDLRFEVRRSQRRKTLQITLERDGSLVFFAPSSCSPSLMEDFARRKQPWIYKKLSEREAIHREFPPKEFKSGEGFQYLGRSYRLLLVPDQDVPVKLEHGRFKMLRSVAGDGSAHMTEWYTSHALPWLSRRVERWVRRVGAEPSSVVVRDLGYRWGSCTSAGRLNFHWRTALLPPRIIDYIVVHELVHVRERGHGETFWRRVERALPDFEARKAWLAAHAAEAVRL